jgi:alanyl-tRNA synthetase
VKTKKLYYENSLATRFSTLVLSCDPFENGYRIVLDSTLFYPEGCGQPSDMGRLGGVTVMDVREEDGTIYHETDGPLDPGTVVFGQIYWERRFPLMQHHTAEHIVSGILHTKYGYDNVGFHMSEECTTLDTSGELDEEALAVVEQVANRAVQKNITLKTEVFRSDGSLPEFRSKKTLDGDVRVVSVPGYDVCACCGLHCATTGQVGVVKIIDAKRYKGGMRLSLLAGERAVADYAAKNKRVREISALLSVKPDEVVAGVQRVLQAGEDLKRRLAACRLELFEHRAREIREDTPMVCMFESDLAPEDLRKLSVLLNDRANVAAVFSDGRYAVSSKTQDMMDLNQALHAALGGKGGGGRQLIQGTVAAGRKEIERFFHEKYNA